jgi:tape measure domain-containing protein
MSPAFRSMNNALHIVLNSFESLQRQSGRAIDTRSIQTAREELGRAEVAFNGIENEINQATQAQNRFNGSARSGGGIVSKLKSAAVGLGAAFGAQKILGLSDNLTNIDARLNMVVDDGGSVKELKDKIYAVAQESRAPFQQVADLVGKLGIQAGDAFKTNDELLLFADQLNKQFVIGSKGQQEIAGATQQLTQALASGVLRGDELNSVLEGAPGIGIAIAKYMDVSKTKIRELAAEGMITADIVKNAMFQASDETNQAFASMPLTWSQLWTKIQNGALKSFTPILTVIGKGASFIESNWSTLQPIFIGLGIAIGAVTLALIANATWTGIVTVARIAMTAWTWLSTTATLAQAGAQWGLNAALYACPLVWIILLIAAIVGVIYGVVAAINHFAGTSISATGIIAGVFAALGVGIYNQFVFIWNYIASFVEFFANVFNNPVYSIKRLFVNLANTIIDTLKSAAQIIDKILGTDLSGGIKNLQKNMDDWLGKMPENYKVVKRLETKTTLDAFNSGYKFGDKLSKKLEKKLEFPKNKAPNIKVAEFEGVKKTAKNTKKMADTMDVSKEDLKYMRDIAEREVVNRFTTASLKLDVTNHNTISNDMDLDGVVDHITNTAREQLAVVAEGANS